MAVSGTFGGVLLAVLAAAAAFRGVTGAQPMCQPDYVYQLGLKPRWELPKDSCLPLFTTFTDFIRATDFTNEDKEDRDPSKARARPICALP